MKNYEHVMFNATLDTDTQACQSAWRYAVRTRNLIQNLFESVL